MIWKRMEIAVAVVLASCGGGDDGLSTGPGAALTIAARSSALQGGQTGTPVAAPPSVKLTRSRAGVAGIVVTFQVASGEGTVAGATATTDVNGVATVTSWKPGRIGVNTLTASASDASGSPITFQATADGGPAMQARYFFADSMNLGTAVAPQWVPAGIRGDGRARNGQTAIVGNLGGEYQGQFCGVSAVIGRGGAYDESASLFMFPSRFWSVTLPASCQPSRGYRFFLDGTAAPPVVLHPLSLVDSIAVMTVGETRTRPMIFQTGGREVGGIRFVDDIVAATSSVLITRLPDVRDELDRPVHQWRIESRGTHRAANTGSGVPYYLPFSLTVTEVPYPFASYP